ncbi:phospholipase D-like domain-containing protein [Pseudomonas hygromyciniae]|uniref:phospholipase D-like domain-containing protein n=1 Tax=Pseudomonas hygromyciniae TaxID=2812000 RepID=UPI001F076945|nr:phospholipase D-like domain-containing protein [Pseudomonas hygromyciniae]
MQPARCADGQVSGAHALRLSAQGRRGDPQYCQRPLHGKVALVDEGWSTVGSSNLDPLSLALNLEANVLIRDRGFNQPCSSASKT